MAALVVHNRLGYYKFFDQIKSFLTSKGVTFRLVSEDKEGYKYYQIYGPGIPSNLARVELLCYQEVLNKDGYPYLFSPYVYLVDNEELAQNIMAIEIDITDPKSREEYQPAIY
jgi:hypothetical protein